MLDWARHAMGDARECWVFGHKEEGIRSAARLLEEWGTEPTPLRIKRRTRVLSTNLHRAEGATFGLEPYETTFSAPDSKLNYVSFPGIFSHGRVDEGTQHLMNYLKTETRAKRVYDLGCGYGVIGIFLADRWGKSRITLGDRSIAAVLCAERNCAAADLENVTLEAVAAQDVTRTQGYDLVVSNPPFHQGKETRTDLMDEFAAAARRLLKGSGRFLAVANSHLPYRRPLEENFKNVDIVWEDSRYRIWQAQGMVSKRAR
jgi:16S rRNA (guanine1207-N2)-methyltransferase